jgi:CheY-like chemotaxis protein
MLTIPSVRNRVLVVDDNQDAAVSLASLLRLAGYNVELAFDGRKAIDIAQRFEPDICILDINMPGMNGYELAQHIRELALRHPPVLATMTAYNDCDHLDRAVDAGFDLHFAKPANPWDVMEQLKECVDEKEHRSHAQ